MSATVTRLLAAIAAHRVAVVGPAVLLSVIAGTLLLDTAVDPDRVATTEVGMVRARKHASVITAPPTAKKASAGRGDGANGKGRGTRGAGGPNAGGTGPGTAPPQTTVPPDLSMFIGPVPPEPWPEGCCAPLTHMGYDSPWGAAGPAVAIKVSNAYEADPQIALNRADMIIEERVHAGDAVSRFLAIYHSRDANDVGPVRSARTTDPHLLASFGRPIIGFSGANDGTLQFVEEARQQGLLVQAHELDPNTGPQAFWRLDNRRDEHSLMVRRNTLVDLLGPQAKPPIEQFRFMKRNQTNPGSVPAAQVDIAVGGTRSGFIWSDAYQTWLHYQYGRPHVNRTNGAQVDRQSVIVLQTQYIPSFADPRSPEAVTVGGGAAWVFTGNTVTLGSWSRSADNQPFNLTDSAGRTILLRPGPVYVALAEQPPSFR